MKIARIALLLLTASSLGSLSCKKKESYSFRLELVAEKDCRGGVPTSGQLTDGTYNVRLTFLQRDSTATIGVTNLRDYTLICDRLIAKGKNIEFEVDTASSFVFSLRVDIFDVNNKLKFFGQREAVDLDGEPMTIYLRPAQTPSCVGIAKQVHAFHTATLLPNGQVLLVGGLVAEGGGDNLQDASTASTSAEIELYDPATSQFQLLQSKIAPRAFHQAVLLPSLPQGPYRVLLLGGVTTKEGNQAAFRLRAGAGSTTPSWFVPHETGAGAAPATLLTLALTGGVKLTSADLPLLPRAMFAQVAINRKGDRLLFVPGATAYAPNTGFTVSTPHATWISVGEGPPAVIGATIALPQLRVGHTVTRLGDERYLIIGGSMTGATGSEALNLASAASANDSQFVNVTPRNGATPIVPQATAWHTVTPIGVGDRELKSRSASAALWAGGFQLTKGANNSVRFATDFAPTQRRLQLLEDQPLRSTDNSVVDGYTISAYHQAIRLYDGSVLITGGNAPASSPFFSLRQIAIFKLDGAALVKQPASRSDGLQIGRFGHRATRLLDNSVLITGGINFKKGGKPTILDRAELIALRTGDASEDYPANRPPGAVGEACPTPGQKAAQLSSPIRIRTSAEPRIGSERTRRKARSERRVVRIRGSDIFWRK